MNDNSFDLLWLIWQTAEKNKKKQGENNLPNTNNKQKGQSNDQSKSEEKQKEYFRKMFNDFREVLNADFPKETATLDFYGQIQMKDTEQLKDTDIRNFLICDTKFFVQEDKNRILDGKFRVFGKIIDIQESENSMEKAFSQLDRNKFFKRTTYESIQKLETFIQGLIPKELFNNKIDLITKGKAIKVLPIVIYI